MPYAWPKRSDRLHPVPEKIATTFCAFKCSPQIYPSSSSDTCCRALRQQLLEISKAGSPFPNHNIAPWKMSLLKMQGTYIYPAGNRWDMLMYSDLWVFCRVKGAVARHMSFDCCRKSPMSFWQPFDLQQQSCPGAPGEWKQTAEGRDVRNYLAW